MKLQKSVAVAFLAAVAGFTKAGSWDDEKIVSRLKLVPEKVDEADVPEEHAEIFTALQELDADEAIELTDDSGTAESPKEKAPKAKGKKPAKESPPEDDADDETNEEPAPSDKDDDEDEPPAPKAKGKKPAKEEKPKAPKAEKKAKINKPAKEPRERDALGCAIGSISAKVNAVVTDDWKDEEAIIKEAGVTKNEARGRLYFAAEQKVFERRSKIEYRLMPSKEQLEKEAAVVGKPSKKKK